MRRRTMLTVPLAVALTGAIARPAAAAGAVAASPQARVLAGRVEELLGKLTLDEKISLLHQWQPAIPRLGMKAFRTGTEALHGLAWLGPATVFPQAIGLASTWNPELIEQVGSAVGDEVRGLQHERPKGWGLNVWSPTVQLLRDPRWGRNEEGYSEDPYLTGVISTAYAKGLSGGDPDHLKTAPLVKHYLANNNEIRRDQTSSDVRPRLYKEYEEPAYKAAIEADVACGVMTAYNLVNGRPCTVTDLNSSVRTWTDRALLNVTDAWAPNNLPATGSQKYFDTLAEADAAVLKAGIDSFTTDDANPANTIAAVNEALKSGLLEESDVDTAVRHILDIRFRLGEFDEDGGPHARIDKSVINSPAHRRLARRAAAEAIVLLKNEGALPLDARKVRKVAVVGPLSDTLYADWYSGELPYKVTPLAGITKRLGAGASVTTSEGVDRIALKNAATGAYITAGTGATGAALKESATEPGETQHFDVFGWGQGVVTLRSAANGKVVGMRDPDGSGYQFFNDQEQPNGWFVSQLFKLEEQSDGSVLLRYSGYENWLGDNVYLRARAADGTLVLGSAAEASRYTREVVRDGVEEAVGAARDADTAIVVVGSMPFINSRETDDREDMGLAAEQSALVKAVFAANPRTVVVVENSYPTTLNWEQKNVPALLWTTHAGQETGTALADVLFGDVDPAGRLTQTWYRSEDDLPSILEYDNIKFDRTYQYFKGEVLYPFGHGLSYTSFRYGTPRAVPGGIEVSVTNTGRRTGTEVVQLYTRQRTSRVKQPLKKLQAFRKVVLKPGQTRSVKLPLTRQDLAHWDVTRSRWVVEDSTYEAMVGSSSGAIRGRTTLDAHGETVPPRDLSRTTRAENFDDYEGVRLVDEAKPRGTAVGAETAGAWLLFADADLRGGAKRLVARIAKESAGEGTIEVRLGAPDGRPAGRATVASTGSRYAYTEVTAALAGAARRQDVYLVLSEGLRLATFSLS
ncbi:glycoside hydrolase family 3 C-terminal domain-containing protein [Streptomyces sp. TRM66268-LWL]|uniref:Glycoside hydrolase family 3 C-terminal domain-containing protein n=1 Tax=Streptomyces polyasparticus TaxID=2767826 RepID=A0ABR7SEA8_9ACTN|nr:glycoside hydrolase family 3 protein [Streptomyces polyasparticus]MBC9713509.1 glycoside hydrolase family 3 C-terminal domain-containing protein [Streptomyces polyasparticus]